MKTIHIFAGADSFYDFLRVDVRRQRQLHQNAVDAGVLVKRFHTGQQVGFAQGSVILFQHRMQSSVFTRFDFVAHIHLTGRVVTHQHNGQPWCDAAGLERLSAGSDVPAQLLGKGVAVNQLCGHGRFTRCFKKQNARHRLGRSRESGLLKPWVRFDPMRF